MPVSSLTITKETLAGPPPRAALLSGSARTKLSTKGLASGFWLQPHLPLCSLQCHDLLCFYGMTGPPGAIPPGPFTTDVQLRDERACLAAGLSGQAGGRL